MSSFKTRSGKCIAAAMACVLTLTSMAGTDVQAAKKAKAKLAKTKLTVNVGKSVSIKLKKKLKKAKYTYASNKKRIATVSKKGKVKGVSAGKANITVTEKVGKKKYKVGTVKVTVKGKGSTTTNPNQNPTASAPAASVVPTAPAGVAPSSDTLASAAPESEAPSATTEASKGPTKTKKPSTQKPPTPTPIVKPQSFVEEESKIETYSVDFAADVRVEESFSVTPDVESGNILKASFQNLTGFHMILPNTDDIKASRFKYVTITYKNTDTELALYVYDNKVNLEEPDLSQNSPNKYKRRLGLKPTGDEFKTITVTLGDDYETHEDGTNIDVAKDSFCGLQIFDYADGTTDLTINSIVFSAKEPKDPCDISQIKGLDKDQDQEQVTEGVEGVVYDEATGEITVADGVEMFTVPLPASVTGGGKLPEGKMVSVTVKGRLAEDSPGIRIWLAEDGNPDATASDQYHYTLENGVGFGGSGDGDVEFKTGEFTIKTILLVGGTGSKNFAADSLTIKGPKWGTMMSGVTITSVEARLVEP